MINIGVNGVRINDFRVKKETIEKRGYNYWHMIYGDEDIEKIVSDSMVRDIIKIFGRMELNKDVVVNLTEKYVIIEGHKVAYEEYQNMIELCYGNSARAILDKVKNNG